jgi:hypothetical protein
LVESIKKLAYLTDNGVSPTPVRKLEDIVNLQLLPPAFLKALQEPAPMEKSANAPTTALPTKTDDTWIYASVGDSACLCIQKINQNLMYQTQEETTEQNIFKDLWEAHKDNKDTKKLMWIALIIVLLVVLVSTLPFVFNALARVIRSYKNLQCAIKE